MSAPPDDRAGEIARLERQLAALRRPEPRQGRLLNRLTVRKIEADTRRKMHADGGSLFLNRKKASGPHWVFCFVSPTTGRRRELGLGPYPEIGLAAARRLRDAARARVRAGCDPVEERLQARLAARLERQKAMTFAQCAKAYLRAHEAAWGDKHREQWGQSLDAYALPVIGSLPVAAIDTALVMQVLEPIWHVTTETASRVRGRIERILDWAQSAGYRPEGIANPARWRGHVENLLPKRARIAPTKNLPALPYAELPALMAQLIERTAELGLGALALRLLILTAARTGEVIGAQWSEIDMTVWTIPARRMKAGREHRVPLSAPALDIIEQLRRLPPSPWLFPNERGLRPISRLAMLRVLRVLLDPSGGGRRAAPATVHGFRSAFSDWCAERTGFPSEVREMALAHAVGSRVGAAYRRGDLLHKRAELMRAWGEYATGPAPAPLGEVVPLRARG